MNSPFSRAKRSSRRSRQAISSAARPPVEQLESRVMLSYTFALSGQTATVSPVASTGASILINEVMVAGNPILEYSQDGGSTFSTDWDTNTPGTQTLAANSSSTIDLTPTTGVGSSVTLGDLSSPASNIFALVHLGVVGTPANNSLVVDDRSSTHAAGNYDFYATLGNITGPGGTLGGIDITSFGPINSYTIEGGPTANIFNIHSTFNATTASTTIIGGAANDTANVLGDISPGIGTALNIDLGGGANTVNVGTGNASVVGAPIAVTDTGGTTALAIDDHSDTTSATATLDNLSGNANALFEVTGLSAGPIEYDASVTSLNINGGTHGTSGVTFDINNTQPGTTTTINGGPNANFIDLSNAGETGGLDNLRGPVIVHGGASFGDVVTLDDSSADFNDSYTVTGTTVSRIVFGGLTYDDNIGTLTLNAENTLGTNGANAIDVNDTADFVNYNINGQNGADTINVNGTGFFGTLDVTAGATDGSTVNVLADNEPVNISANSTGGGDVVNIGSTGGAGSMTSIDAPINITDVPGFYTLNFHDENDTTSQSWTLDDDNLANTASVAVAGLGTTSYRPIDLQSPLTINGGSGGNTFAVNGTARPADTVLNAGVGNDTVNVFATGGDTLDINGQGGSDTVTIGGVANVGMQEIQGAVNVSNTLGLTSLILDDSQDTSGKFATLTAASLTGLCPGFISWVATDIDSLRVSGGTGGNTFVVTSTLGDPSVSSTLTTLNTGFGNDLTDVSATASNGTLDINGQNGTDVVNLGDIGGNMQNILGPVNITNTFAFSAITLDDSADPTGRTFTLAGGAGTGTMTGISPGVITYNTGDASTVAVNAGTGSDNFTIDLSAGNPIPNLNANGLNYTGGGGASNVLNLVGTLPSGAFSSEVHNATGHGAGNISLVDASSVTTGLTYSGLSPVNDTAAALLYTFNILLGATADPTFAITDGAVFGGFQTAQIASSVSPTSFETTTIANKTVVAVNTGSSGEDQAGSINLPNASTGLTSLNVNTLAGENDQLNIIATPAGLPVSGNLGSGSDTANVSGAGVPAGTNATFDGGTGIDTLNYDAGGAVPTITAGALPGELLITTPGAGTVDAKNFENLKLTNAAPALPTAGIPITLTGVEGHGVGGTVATFHSSVPGVKASQFTVTVNYGDGTSGAGVITQDAVDQSLFYVTATHTYAEEGAYTTAVTVRYNGGTTSSVINGVTVKTTTAPASPVSVPGSASIADAPLTGTATAVNGSAGSALNGVQVATFVDTGGAEAASHYTVTINWGDGTTSTGTVTLSGSNFAAKGTHTYAAAGTFHTTVTIKDVGGSSITLTSTAHITASVLITPGSKTVSGSNILEGRSFTAAVATFHDNNSASTTAKLSATINWGDGTTSTGSIVSNGSGNFTVNGTHTYHDEGTYHPVISIHDTDGQSASVTSTVIVLDAPLVNGHGTNFSVAHNTTFTNHFLGSFTDEDATNTPAQNDYVGTINWGDGTPTTHATFTKTGATTNVGSFWNVYGTHKYTTAGAKHVTITVVDGGGGTPVTFTLTITVT
ncbi:MAG TPA: hypothetical protein VFE47_01020 [Tepidisphaeraceae bacterium]|jgi:hypothetical protein|nr:hypothetical protein [Tepidisphaeraceae bacterium]